VRIVVVRAIRTTASTTTMIETAAHTAFEICTVLRSLFSSRATRHVPQFSF
jgi:hypothetical protein